MGRCEAEAKLGGISFLGRRRTFSAFPGHSLRPTSSAADRRTISETMTQRRSAKHHPKKGGLPPAPPPSPFPSGAPRSRLRLTFCHFKTAVLAVGAVSVLAAPGRSVIGRRTYPDHSASFRDLKTKPEPRFTAPKLRSERPGHLSIIIIG